MNELSNILILISVILIWVDTDIFIRFRLKRKLNIKPFNCAFCLCFWGAVVLSLVFHNLFYLTAPLFLNIIERRLI